MFCPKRWILSFVVAAGLAAAIAAIGPGNMLTSVLLVLSEDTEYAPEYSESSFRRLAVGDSETAVQEALGQPLSERPAKAYSSWLYAPDAHPEYEVDGEYPDLGYSFTAIRFGEDGRFEAAFGQISRGSSSTLFGVQTSGSIGPGMNTLQLAPADIEKLKSERALPKQIQARFGSPTAKFESRVVRWLQYSHSPGSTHYRQRLIGIDRDGFVCRKVSKAYWD